MPFAPLCAPDHLAKSLGVLRLAQPSAGVLEWTTATGLRVRVVPGRDGEVTLLPRAPRQQSRPARTDGPEDTSRTERTSRCSPDEGSPPF